MRILLFCLLIGFGSAASAIRFVGDDEIIDCSKLFLEGALPRLTDKKSEDISAYVISFEYLDAILLQSGLTPSKIDLVMKVVLGIVRRHPEDPQLTGVDRLLTRKKPAFCILRGDCALKDRESLMLFGSDEPFELVDFEKISQEGAGWVQVPLLTSYWPRIMLLNPIPNAVHDLVHWATLMLQELSFYSDVEMIDEWLHAAKRLKEADQTTDTIYRNHVVVRSHQGKKNVSLIDEGFFRVFLGSRAYEVRNHLDREMFPDHAPATERSTAEECLSQLKGQPSTSLTLEDYDVTVDSLFEFGKEMGHIMQDTIYRADALH